MRRVLGICMVLVLCSVTAIAEAEMDADWYKNLPEYDADIEAQCADSVGALSNVPVGLSLNTRQASGLYDSSANVTTEGIFAVHWNPSTGATEQKVSDLLDRLHEVRCLCLEWGMEDPPTVGRNVYYNVFFEDGRGQGQGTHMGLPYLNLPVTNPAVEHEGFHIFQYDATAPGFEYAGDSQWFIETSAQWFKAYMKPTATSTFIEAMAILYNPHLALWHSFSNEAPGDPDSSMWTYGVRQYALGTWLYYLTEIAGVMKRAAIPAAFYTDTAMLPQEFFYRHVGEDVFRVAFADWAAHSCADFDYLTRSQERYARMHSNGFVYQQENLVAPFVAELSSEGTGGSWQSPPPELQPRGWSFNVVRVEYPTPGVYEMAIQGDAEGSLGAPSHFEARFVAMYGRDPAVFAAFDMVDELAGSATVEVAQGATELYLVIAAVPAHFTGNQSYGYQYRVTGP